MLQLTRYCSPISWQHCTNELELCKPRSCVSEYRSSTTEHTKRKLCLSSSQPRLWMDAMLASEVEVRRRFGGTHYFHLLGWCLRLPIFCFIYFSILMTVAAFPSERSASLYTVPYQETITFYESKALKHKTSDNTFRIFLKLFVIHCPRGIHENIKERWLGTWLLN
jgi:hypothetical protein